MPQAPSSCGLGRHTRRRPRRAAFVVGALAGALAVGIGSASSSPRSGSLSLARTKSEASWARWQYRLSFVPSRNASSVKLTWTAATGLRITGTGIERGVRVIKSVRAGQRVTVGFWAWSSAAAKLCFTVKASTGNSARACNPNPGSPGRGQQLLEHYAIYCYPNSAEQPNCLHNGVVGLRVVLDDECGNCYQFGNSGVPVTVTVYPQGFSFSGSQAAGFSGKITTQPGGGGPKPTKKDKTWYWTTVVGQKVPQWRYGHLFMGSIPNWLFTITVPAGTAKVCIKVVAQSVWAAPVATATECFTDPSVNNP